MPAACYVGSDGEKFYQYTMIEEESRERYIYACKEASSYSTVDFVQRAILYFWICSKRDPDGQRRRIHAHTKDKPDASAGRFVQQASYPPQDNPP